MFNFIRVGIVCSLMLTPTAVWATHPFTVEDTATEGKGNSLVELTGDYSKDSSIKMTTETLYMTIGAGDQVDLSIAVPYLTLNPGPVTDELVRGMGDVRILFKQQIFENEVKQSMAYEVYGVMPTGKVQDGLGTNNVVWGAKLIDTQECGNNAFHLNVGYELFGRNIKKWHFLTNYAFPFGLSVEHKFTESFRILAEVSGEVREQHEIRSRPFRAGAGMIYDLSKSWYVDLGIQAGLNKYAEDYAALAGMAWRF